MYSDSKDYGNDYCMNNTYQVKWKHPDLQHNIFGQNIPSFYRFSEPHQAIENSIKIAWKIILRITQKKVT